MHKFVKTKFCASRENKTIYLFVFLFVCMLIGFFDILIIYCIHLLTEPRKRSKLLRFKYLAAIYAAQILFTYFQTA